MPSVRVRRLRNVILNVEHVPSIVPSVRELGVSLVLVMSDAPPVVMAVRMTVCKRPRPNGLRLTSRVRSRRRTVSVGVLLQSLLRLTQLPLSLTLTTECKVKGLRTLSVPSSGGLWKVTGAMAICPTPKG